MTYVTDNCKKKNIFFLLFHKVLIIKDLRRPGRPNPLIFNDLREKPVHKKTPLSGGTELLPLVMVTVVDVRVLIAKLEESELVLPVTDFVAERNLISLAEISGLKVGVKGGDVAFDF